jgi:hypothetical protein
MNPSEFACGSGRRPDPRLSAGDVELGFPQTGVERQLAGFMDDNAVVVHGEKGQRADHFSATDPHDMEPQQSSGKAGTDAGWRRTRNHLIADKR